MVFLFVFAEEIQIEKGKGVSSPSVARESNKMVVLYFEAGSAKERKKIEGNMTEFKLVDVNEGRASFPFVLSL